MNPRKFVITYTATRHVIVSEELYAEAIEHGTAGCRHVKALEEDQFDAPLVFDSHDTECTITVFELPSTDKKP